MVPFFKSSFSSQCLAEQHGVIQEKHSLQICSKTTRLAFCLQPSANAFESPLCKLHFDSHKGPGHTGSHFLRSALAWETSVGPTEQSSLLIEGLLKFRSDSPPKAQELAADGNNAKHVRCNEGGAPRTSS